jgi:hypothetical protein
MARVVAVVAHFRYMPLLLKMVTTQQMSWCILQLAKKGPVTAVQHAFRRQFHMEPPSRITFRCRIHCHSWGSESLGTHCTKSGTSLIMVSTSAVWHSEQISSLCEVCTRLSVFLWTGECEVLSMKHFFLYHVESVVFEINLYKLKQSSLCNWIHHRCAHLSYVQILTSAPSSQIHRICVRNLRWNIKFHIRTHTQ